MPKLTLLPGSAVSTLDHDQLHVELAVARGERLRHATEARSKIRSALRLLASGHPAAATTMLIEAEHVLEAEALRAMSMEAPCPCGVAGSGHGPADDDAIAAPLRVAA